jgi:hypothetical protein
MPISLSHENEKKIEDGIKIAQQCTSRAFENPKVMTTAGFTCSTKSISHGVSWN